MIGIIKTSSQNTGSIINCFNYLNIKTFIIDDLNQVDKFKKIIIPGVGSFNPIVKSLKSIKITNELIKKIFYEKQVFAICIGLQILCKKSEEGDEKGVGIIQREVKHLKNLKCKLAIPHVGFNSVKLHKKDEKIEKYLDKKFYFTHSYGVENKKLYNSFEGNYGITKYGGAEFVSFISYKKSMATQFHPEKSGENGLGLLNYFYNM